jgi:hypothetical protein
MRKALLSAALAATYFAMPASSFADPNVFFKMVPSSATCLPNANARVTISTHDGLQYMHVETFGLPPSNGFDFFVIQVPKAPFGMSWYQGDIKTDSHGFGIADFVGVFSNETFIVAPGIAPAPLIFPTDAATNPATPPVQMYHLGLWFDSPAEAVAAGCGNATTPFNGTHNAGVQVLNTSNFPDLHGPLLSVF